MKVALTIAGSDSGGCAGIQADLKTFEYFGVFGCSAITALTAQNSCKVNAIEPLNPSFVSKQIESVLEDFEVDAIKIGMLFDKNIINTVYEIVKNLNIPIILDTVAVTNTGEALLKKDAQKELLKLAKISTLITPNKKELKLLLNLDIEPDATYIYTNCFEIYNFFGTKTVVKNYIEDMDSIDYLITKEGLNRFTSPYINSTSTHGTGCSFSSAIAANIALGKNIEEAISLSKNYISKAIAKAPSIGHCGGPIRHNLFRG